MRQRTDTNPVHSLAHSAADILLFMRPAAQTQPPIRKTFPNSLSRSMSFPWPHYALHTGLRWWCRPAGPTQPTTWDALTSPRDRSYHGAHTHPGSNGTHAIVHGPRACTPSKCSARWCRPAGPTQPTTWDALTSPRDRSYHAHTHPGTNGTHASVHGPRACSPSKCSARSPTRPILQRCSTVPRCVAH